MANTNSGKKTKTNPQLIKNHILKQAGELFLKHGFSRVTVDEIAHELGMSKKTIYIHFVDKKTIIKSVIRKNQQQLIKQIDDTLNNSDLNFMQKMQTTMKTLSVYFSKMSPDFIRNLKRHSPELWLQINEFKQKQGFKRVQQLVQEGIKEGVIRNDIPAPLLIALYYYLVENIFTSEKINELPYPAPELFEGAIKLIYGGMLTNSARKAFIKRESDD